jgi:hypothetical protein
MLSCTLRDLAKKVGYTNMGTLEGLQRLIKNGTIKVPASIKPRALVLHLALVMLEMESAVTTQEFARS